ncbi:MAG: hypothetical protein ACP5NZ_00440 [Nanobdellota archaeon]
MNLKQKLENAKDKFIANRASLDVSRESEGLYRRLFKVGLGGGAYLGFRTLIGPEIDIGIEDITNTWGVLDNIGACIGSFAGGLGGLGYAIAYLGRRGDEKRLEEARTELEKISMEYKSQVKLDKARLK